MESINSEQTNLFKPPLGFWKVKSKKQYREFLHHHKWIVLQFNKFSDYMSDLEPFAVLVNRINFQDILNLIPKKKKILIIGNRADVLILYKICKFQKRRAWVCFLN